MRTKELSSHHIFYELLPRITTEKTWNISKCVNSSNVKVANSDAQWTDVKALKCWGLGVGYVYFLEPHLLSLPTIASFKYLVYFPWLCISEIAIATWKNHYVGCYPVMETIEYISKWICRYSRDRLKYSMQFGIIKTRKQPYLSLLG